MSDNPFESPASSSGYDHDDADLARYLVRRMWQRGLGALGFGLVSFCCNPLTLCSFGAIALGIDTVVRLVKFDPELKPSAPSSEMTGAAIVGAFGAFLGLSSLLLLIVGLALRML